MKLVNAKWMLDIDIKENIPAILVLENCDAMTEIVEDLYVLAPHTKKSSRVHLPEVYGRNIVLQAQQTRILPDRIASFVLDHGLEEPQPVLVRERTAGAPECRSKPFL